MAVEVSNGFIAQILGDIAMQELALHIGIFELAALDEGALEGGGDLLGLLNDVGEADVVEAGIYAAAVEGEGVAAALYAQGAALLLEHGEEVLQVGEHSDGLLLDEGIHIKATLGGFLNDAHGALDALHNGRVVEEEAVVVLIGELVTKGAVGEGGDVEAATGHGGGLTLLFETAHFITGRGVNHAHKSLGGGLHEALLYALRAIDGTAGEPDIETGGTRRLGGSGYLLPQVCYAVFE